MVLKKTATQATVYVGQYYERSFDVEDGEIVDKSPVPMGTILPFAANACPADWLLVSGTNEQGIFNERFIQGGTESGLLSGTDTHTHPYSELPTHSHAVGTLATGSAGGHTHQVRLFGSSGSGNYPQSGSGYLAGGSTTASGSHTHTLQGNTASAGATGLSTSSTTIQPPYLEVIYCRKNAINNNGIPENALAIYDAGSTLPEGWEHFSALDERFPLGAAAYGATGGAATHTHTYTGLPAHDHTAGSLTLGLAGSHSHTFSYFANSFGGSYLQGSTAPSRGTFSTAVATAGEHTHTLSGQTAETGVASATTVAAGNLPPYKTVSYARKTLSDDNGFPVGSIMLWEGSTCPNTWARETSLDGLYPMGGTVPGTGGSATHSHAYTEVPAHSHGVGSLALVSGGAHTHGFTFAQYSTGTGSGRVYGSNVAGSWASVLPEPASSRHQASLRHEAQGLSSSGAHVHTISGTTGASGLPEPCAMSQT